MGAGSDAMPDNAIGYVWCYERTLLRSIAKRESIMTPQAWVLDFLMVYIFVKALVLAPLAWMTLVYRWAERQEQRRIDAPTQSEAAETALAA